MKGLRRIIVRLFAPISRRRDERRLREEIEEHLAAQTADNIRAGLPAAEARRQAVLKFGAVEAVKENYREQRSLPLFESLFADIRYAGRGLRKSPAFTVTAFVTLAVCLGASTALFSVVDHVLLRPLRIPQSDRVVLIYNSYPKAGAEHAGATAPDYFDRMQGMTVFEEQALFNTRNPSLDVSGLPEQIQTMQVTPSFFRLIRVSPRLGRGFTDEEGQIGKNRVVILSSGLVQRLFGEREPLGHTVKLNGELHTIVGVMPADFSFIEPDVQAWVPLTFTDRQKTQRFANNYAYLGRLKPGTSVAEAQAQLDRLNSGNLERYPETKQVVLSTGFHSVATRLQDDLVREVRSVLFLLWSGALFVLLIGCVNVASLALVRSRVRLKEFATRMALGAGYGRIIWQLVTEQTALTVASAIGGLAIADASLRLFGAMNLSELPRGTEISMDGRVVTFAMLTSVLIGIVLGMVPVVGGLPASLSTILREGGRTGTSGQRARNLRRALVVTQVAVAFVLLISAGLLFASFRRVLAIEPGFAPDAVLTASINLPEARYTDDAAIRRFTDGAVQALRSIPGVVAAGATSYIPFSNNFTMDLMFPEGYRLPPGESFTAMYRSRVTPGYFEAMRVRLLSGRFFDDRDRLDAPKAVIVDERLAKRYWPGVDPIGRRMYEPSDTKNVLAITPKTEWFTVVGVVKEMKLRGLVEGVGDNGAFFTAQAQEPQRVLTFTLRSSGEPLSVARAVRTQLAQLDRELPVFDVQTMAERTDRSLVTRRSSMRLSLIFGGVALFLSSIGIYGVLAYFVTQRTREIGVRLALGSSIDRIFGLILREGASLIAAGLVLGGLGAVAVRKTIEGQLFAVGAGDPLVLLLVTAMVASIGLTACVIPARRATRVDPLVALRYE